MSEATLSFKFFKYVQAFDVAKCYTMLHLEGDFLFCSLNVWFSDIPDCKKPLIFLWLAMPFVFALAASVLKMAISKFVYSYLLDNDLKTIVDLGRFAYNIIPYASNMKERGK